MEYELCQPTPNSRSSSPQSELDPPTDALFDFGKSDMQDMKVQSRQSVEQYARLLHREYSEQSQLVLTGYTDRTGPPESNQILAIARAQLVPEILQRSGIDPNRITTQGKGSTNPLGKLWKRLPDFVTYAPRPN
ncbi:OmpA family protein [Pseudomonas sp. TH31]|uniref:OmpA family protein n=1 Tax=Pseudomonas sp. TH31 TaxID=2796396 RepID=UPI0019125672|nr:OmpA family protein [Pseudomonas sp. TH31]MBK5416169.1 OmpA family protein [Pseudomonas sp. TH31]